MQDNVRYAVIGLSNAPEYFDIDSASGEIRITKDLRLDPVSLKVYEVCN